MNNWDDPDSQKIGMQVLELLAQHADPVMNRKLQELGVSSPDQLPPEKRQEIFLGAIREVGPKIFPDIDIDKFVRGFASFTDKQVINAFLEYSESDQPKDAFEPAMGLQAALIVAGVGIKIAPFDLKKSQLVSNYANDLAEVRAVFGNASDSIICYNSAESEFYSLQTDCIKTLRYKVNYQSECASIRHLFKRAKLALPTANERFVHFAAVFPRRKGDRIASLNLLDDRADKGSVILNAGWMNESGIVMGCHLSGRAAFPAGLVREISRNSQLAFWLTEPHDKPPITFH